MLDLSRFKKVAGDKTHTVFRHMDNGAELKVAHESLSPLHRKQLQRLPIYAAEGGEMEAPLPEISSDTQTPPLESESLMPSAGEYMAAAGPGGTIPPGVPAVAETPSPSEPPREATLPAETAAQAPAAQAGPLDSVTLEGIAKSGFENADQQAKIEAAAANKQAALALKNQQDLQDEQTKWNAREKVMTDQQDAALKDYDGHHINPNHYMESLSTVGKVSTAIGLLLGGISSGTTGHNPAAEWLDHQIDRDIEAQKSNRNGSLNLFNAYMHQYGNARTAESMTKATMAGIYASKIEEAAARSGSQMAAVRGKIAANNLRSQIYPLVQSAHLMKMAEPFNGSNPSAATGSENQYHVLLTSAQRLDPALYKDLQSKYLPGVGVAAVPVKPEDGATLAGYKQLNDLAKQAQDLSQKERFAFPGTAHAQKAKDLQNAMQLEVNKLLGLNRINEFEGRKFEELVKDPSQWNTTRAVQSFKDLRNLITSKTQAEGTRLGIRPFQR